MVASDTSGNMIRPPNRSVSPPTGIRPSDPTTTGTATTSACWNEDSCRTSLNLGPSGLSSAQAQKFTANPTVARASIRPGRPAPGRTGSRAGAVLPAVSGLPIVDPVLHHQGKHAAENRRTFLGCPLREGTARDLGPGLLGP